MSPRKKTSARSGETAKPWETAKAGKGSGADPLATRFVQSLSYDRRLYTHDIAGSLAHANMLKQVGLITAKDLAQITRGLKKIQKQIATQGDLWPGWKMELEDVHMCIESALIALTGDAGRKLHTGRSRNDQVALDLKLWLGEATCDLEKQFGKLFKAFISLAQNDGKIVMPSYTHLQRAQPIVVGGELMAWLAGLDRCLQRVLALNSINKNNPLGSGAIAGTALPIDRKHTSQSLGVGPPTASAIDSTATRDAAIDFVYGLSMIAQTLSRWAEQWIIYASTEFGFIKLDARYTTGSSMMPQKRNPDMLELIRGRCSGVYGQLVSLLSMCKGITIGYNRDLQEDKRYLFAAYDTMVDVLAMAANIVATTRFDEAAIAQTLDRGFLDATSLAEYLVTQGIPFRSAHQIVGQLVCQCESQGLVQLSHLPLTDFQTACQAAGQKPSACQKQVYDWLGAHNVVRRYQSAGNAGLQGFAKQLKHWQKRL